jgi:hypothetical protein
MPPLAAFSDAHHDELVRRIATHLEGGNYENSELAAMGMAETLVEMLTSSFELRPLAAQSPPPGPGSDHPRGE